MWFWWFMFVCSLLIPVILIVWGRKIWKYCPKEINRIYGYRTERSMKNIDTWTFAHQYCGKLWWKIGRWMLVPVVLAMIPFYDRSETAISIVGIIVMLVQIAVLMASVVLTEKALERTFNDDGTRK